MPRLKYKNANKNAKKSYRPAKGLDNLIRRWLQYREDVGEMTQEQKDKKKTSLKNRRESLYKSKVIVLNKHIFPAMANLTRLVEAMHEESIISEKFEDDLKALFLTKSEVSKNNKSIFERFIAASCTLTSAKEYKTGKMILSPDFRLVLLDIMQRVIYRKMEVIGPLKFKASQSWKKTLKLDMERALHGQKRLLMKH